MAKRGTFKSRSRKLALLLLLVFGSLVILLGLMVLSVGLAITHHDDFHDNNDMKAEVEPGNDYVQYWIGLPYVFTGVSVACSAVNLRRIPLTVCTLTLSIACIVLSLAGLVVDGPDWVKWKDLRVLQSYWEGQDGYACMSRANTCICEGPSKQPQDITSFTDCKTLMDLSSIYGVLIGCFVFALIILLLGIILIVYIITSKAEKARRSRKGPVTKVIELNGSIRQFEKEYPRGSANRGYGYEMPADRIQTSDRSRRSKDLDRMQTSYRGSRSKDLDSVSQQPKEGSTVNGGVVMLDPGHFHLGEDDIY